MLLILSLGLSNKFYLSFVTYVDVFLQITEAVPGVGEAHTSAARRCGRGGEDSRTRHW